MWQKQRIFGWKKVFWTPPTKKNKHLTSCDQVASPSPRTWASQKNSQLCWRNVRWFSEDPKNIPGFFETKPCFLSFGNEEKPVDLLGEAYLFWRIPPYVVPSLVAPHSDRRILLPLSSLPWLRKKSELPKLLSNQSASCKSGMCTLPQVGMKMSPRNFVFQLFALNNLFQLEKSSIWPISNPNSEKKKNKLQEKGQTKKKHTHNRHCSRKRRVSRKSLFLRLICCFDEFHLAAASVKSVSLPPTWSRPRIEWWKSPWYINSQTSQSGTSRLQIENIVFKLEMIQVLSQQFLEHCFCIQKKIAISTWWKKRFNQKKTKVQPPCQWAPEQHCPNLNGGLVGRKVHPSKSEGESSPQSQPDAEPTLDS